MKLFQLQQSFTFLSLPLLLSPIPGTSALPILGGTSPLNGLLPSYRVPLFHNPMSNDPMGNIERFLPNLAPENRAKMMRYLRRLIDRPSYMDVEGERISDDHTLARRDISFDWDDDSDAQPSSDDTENALAKRDSNQLTHRHEKRQFWHALNWAFIIAQFMPYITAISQAMTWSPILSADDYLAQWHPDWRHALYKFDTFGKNIPYDKWKQYMSDQKVENGMASYDEQKEIEATYAKKFKDYIVLHHKIPSPMIFAQMPKEIDPASPLKQALLMLAREPNGEALIAEALPTIDEAINTVPPPPAKPKARQRERLNIAENQPVTQKKTPAKPRPAQQQQEEGGLSTEGQPVAATANTPNQPNTDKAGKDMPDFSFDANTAIKLKGAGAGAVFGATMPKTP